MRSRTKRRKGPRKPRKYSLDGRIIAALRKVWRYHPTRLAAVKAARVANGRSRCAKCLKVVIQTYIDHTEPVVDPATGRKSWDEYIKRMFFPAEVKALCKPCHAAKTKAENEQRKRARKESE